jgi:exopolyphosphatase / guanosine-5'-triphosphate,3'-diphosphate pyrophosphatase
MPHASIDLGSNTILLLVVDETGRVLADESAVVGLGRGLGEHGLLKADRMDAAIGVLDQYRAILEPFGVAPSEVRVAGTSAMRRALNAKTFTTRIQRETGFKVETISGDEEARLTAAGGLTGLELPDGPLLVVDTGGGSTELVFLRYRAESEIPPRLIAVHSVEMGTVRLTDALLSYQEVVRAPALAKARDAVNALFGRVPCEPRPRACVAVAGAPTCLSAAQLGLREFDEGRVHGSSLELSTLRTWIDRLAAADIDERRRLMPATPDRADTMLAGAIILEAVLSWARRPSTIVSARGLRHALIPIPVS